MRSEDSPELPHGVGQYPSEVWDDGRASPASDTVADEVPVALMYNGASHAVMLATPADLEDFGIGFSLSEGIVAGYDEIRDCEVAAVHNGIVVDLTVPDDRFAQLEQRRRNLAGRTGCGLCGTESLDHVFRSLPTAHGGFELDIDALSATFDQLKARQPLHALTGAVHAAGWGRTDGTLGQVREDVGRHNALDKLIGAMARRRASFDDGFVLLTSRASSEMVQKAAMMGVQVVAAISAPTGLAIRLAEQCGVTLIGFVRGRRHAIYSRPDRVRAPRVKVTP